MPTADPISALVIDRSPDMRGNLRAMLGQCGIEHSCGVRANWRRINDVVSDALREVTLAQMLLPPAARPARKGIAMQLANA